MSLSSRHTNSTTQLRNQRSGQRIKRLIVMLGPGRLRGNEKPAAGSPGGSQTQCQGLQVVDLKEVANVPAPTMRPLMTTWVRARYAGALQDDATDLPAIGSEAALKNIWSAIGATIRRDGRDGLRLRFDAGAPEELAAGAI
jgi:hypothetical protein